MRPRPGADRHSRRLIAALDRLGDAEGQGRVDALETEHDLDAAARDGEDVSEQ